MSEVETMPPSLAQEGDSSVNLEQKLLQNELIEEMRHVPLDTTTSSQEIVEVMYSEMKSPLLNVNEGDQIRLSKVNPTYVLIFFNS